MDVLFKWVGRLAGLAGIALALFSVYVRLRGAYTYGGFQIGTLFLASIGAISLGCLGYVASIAEAPRR